MRFVTALLVTLLLAPCVTFAQFPDELPADTVRTDSLPVWADTTVAFPDSTVPAGFRNTWLYPIGAMLVTSLGFVLLFTTRSR